MMKYKVQTSVSYSKLANFQAATLVILVIFSKFGHLGDVSLPAISGKLASWSVFRRQTYF